MTNTNQLVDDLLALRDLLTQPGAWTQKANARDANGVEVLATYPEAVAWCLRGGAWRVAAPNADRVVAVGEAMDAVCPARSYVNWQDDPERTQDDVVALVDEAVRWAKEQGDG